MRAGGSAPISHIAMYIGHGKAIRALSRFRPWRMIRAALSASMMNGMGKALFSVIRVRTYPGSTTESRIPSARSQPRSASPYDLTAALLAE